MWNLQLIEIGGRISLAYEAKLNRRQLRIRESCRDANAGGNGESAANLDIAEPSQTSLCLPFGLPTAKVRAAKMQLRLSSTLPAWSKSASLHIGRHAQGCSI